VSDDPIITELAARPLRLPPRSAITQWVEANLAGIVEARARASWEEIAALCRKHGLTDRRGNPVTERQLIETYSRVKRQRSESRR
jgi:hypothetical protein